MPDTERRGAWRGTVEALRSLLAELHAPPGIERGLAPPPGVAAGDGECTREWGDACDLPGSEPGSLDGRTVTLTCTFHDSNGKPYTESRTWCSPGQPQQ